MKKYTQTIVFSVIILAFSYYQSLVKKDHEAELTKKGKIITAIISHPYLEKGSLATNLLYKFSYSDKEIKQSKACYNLNTAEGKLFSNKKFPVLVLDSDPEINRLLVFPSDFEKYNLPFPDSLSWVRRFKE